MTMPIFLVGGINLDANNVENIVPRTGYIIMYVGWPLFWCSKLQMEITLSMMESEYIALSRAMCGVLPFMALLKEFSFIFNIHLQNLEFFCKVFEDNQICIVVDQSNRFFPRTKHISIKYHNFRRYVQKKLIWVCYIDTAEQTADNFTESLNIILFLYPQINIYD